MPTRPSDSLPEWATSGNFPASVYPAVYPWGDPHPDAGNPTPWGGQPKRDTTGLAAFAAAGVVPAQPTDAPLFNEWLRRVWQWVAWVEGGSAAGQADTHIVETDGDGEIAQFSASLGGSTTVARTLLVSEPGGAGGVAAVVSSLDTSNPAATFAGLGQGDSVVQVTSSGEYPALEVENTWSGSGAASQGRAILATGQDTGAAVEGYGDVDGSGLFGYSGISGGSGVRGQARHSSSEGVYGIGSGLGAGSRGVRGIAQHVDATGVRGSTIGGASSSATGVTGAGLGDGTGVHGDAADGYGVMAESDTSSPVRSAFRIVPQDADPTTPLEGDMYHRDLEGPATYAAALWRRIWYTTAGIAHGFGHDGTGPGAPGAVGGGTFTTIATAAVSAPLAPRKTGTVLIEVSGNFGFNVSPGGVPSKIGELRVFDNTSGVNVTAVRNLYGLVDDSALADPGHSFSWVFAYAVPAAGPRTFLLQMRSTYGSNMEHEDCSIRVVGTY